jgi:hypothetical protein
MSNTVRKPPHTTVGAFRAGPGDGAGRKRQLIDGEAHVMSPGGITREIAVARSTPTPAGLPHRDASGNWPEVPLPEVYN